MLSDSGRLPAPVSALTVIGLVAPRLVVATEKAPAPLDTLTIPSLLIVAASAMMSGAGPAEAVSSSVLTPLIVGADPRLAHWKLKATSVVPNEAPGVNAITNDCEPPAAMPTGVLGVPLSALVAEFVVW